MQPWFIPMFYLSGAVLGGLALPRIEHGYLTGSALGVSVSSAQALLSAAASGMMALTGIVFAMAFVMAQFSAIAYSPRLVLWFARDRMLFHALGAFTATFVYALFTLAWVDRGGLANVPLFSMLLVGIMIIVSMLLFSRMMQRLGDLQIGNVLHLIGDQGRTVIADMFGHQKKDESRLAAAHPAESAGEHTCLPARPRHPNGKVSRQSADYRQARCRFPCCAGAGGGSNDRDGQCGRRHAGRRFGSPPCSWLGTAGAGGRARQRRPSPARVNLRAGSQIPDPASRRYRHQGVVAGDQ